MLGSERTGAAVLGHLGAFIFQCFDPDASGLDRRELGSVAALPVTRGPAVKTPAGVLVTWGVWHSPLGEGCLVKRGKGLSIVGLSRRYFLPLKEFSGWTRRVF